MRPSMKIASHLILAMTVAFALTVSVAAGQQKVRTVVPAYVPSDEIVPSVVMIHDDLTRVSFAIELNTFSPNFGIWVIADKATGEFHTGRATSVIFLKGGKVRITQQAVEPSDTSMLMTATINYICKADSTIACYDDATGTAMVTCFDPHIVMHVRDTVALHN